MTTWTIDEAEAVVRAWDCPEDMRVMLLPAPPGGLPVVVLLLRGGVGCGIELGLRPTARLDGLPIALDGAVVLLRHHHGGCAMPRRLRLRLAYAAVRFEVGVRRAAWRQARRAMKWRAANR